MAQRRISAEKNDGLDKEWMEAAESMEDINDYAEFLRHLVEDYKHSYDSIVDAIIAAMMGVFNVIDESGCGGITGFQASCVAWTVFKRLLCVEGPLQMIRFERMLYANCDEEFKIRLTRQAWEWVQDEAKRMLENADVLADAAVKHLESIVAGRVPYGIELEDNDERNV